MVCLCLIIDKFLVYFQKSLFQLLLNLVKYYNENTRTAIIRCRHGPHRLLASSIPFLSNVGKRKMQLHGIYTGATMVKCFKFLKVCLSKSVVSSFFLCVLSYRNIIKKSLMKLSKIVKQNMKRKR